MSRMYVLSNILTTVTAANHIAEIGAQANRSVIIHSVSVSQNTSEADDSTEIQLGTYTTTGTGTTVTARPLDKTDTAFAGVCKDNHSADLSVGEVILYRKGISLLAGYDKIWTPAARPVILGGEFFAVKIAVAITSVDINYEIEFEEVG